MFGNFRVSSIYLLDYSGHQSLIGRWHKSASASCVKGLYFIHYVDLYLVEKSHSSPRSVSWPYTECTRFWGAAHNPGRAARTCMRQNGCKRGIADITLAYMYSALTLVCSVTLTEGVCLRRLSEASCLVSSVSFSWSTKQGRRKRGGRGGLSRPTFCDEDDEY